MSALIPALIQLLMSGRGRGGGGGGGGSRGGRGRSGGSGRSSGRSRKPPADPQEELDKRAEKSLYGGSRSPFGSGAGYGSDDQSQWNSIFKALGGEMEYPEPEIPEYDYEE
jgi:hypothetical protein